MRSRLLLLVPAALLALATPASAVDSPSQVAAALRSSPVFQSQNLDLVDVAALRDELSGTDPQVYVAVLSADNAASATAADRLATSIGRSLGRSDAVVLVITANRHLGAGEGEEAADAGVDADAALSAELADVEDTEFSKDNLTAFVASFRERIAEQASGSGSSGSGGGGGHTGLYLLGGLGVLGAGAALYVRRSRRTRSDKTNEGLRADVEQLYGRLGSDVSTLAPGDDKVARQALADAAERYNACGAALATADTPEEFAAARRTAVEGLTAARVARKQLGLDLGPDIPAPPATGPQLDADRQVVLDGQAYDGSPDYRPGRQHYYGGGVVGGQTVLGGWYSAPFWEPFLLGSLLSGGFGGGFGGGGYERGYEAGREDSTGDWGGSDGGGGGDWGGGGDGGGGGDW